MNPRARLIPALAALAENPSFRLLDRATLVVEWRVVIGNRGEEG